MNPRRDHYRDQDEVLSVVPLAAQHRLESRRWDSGGAMDETEPATRPVIVACVRGLAISVPLWYGRMRGRGVEKNIRARRCIVYPRTFYPAGEEKGGDVR